MYVYSALYKNNNNNDHYQMKVVSVYSSLCSFDTSSSYFYFVENCIFHIRQFLNNEKNSKASDAVWVLISMALLKFQLFEIIVCSFTSNINLLFNIYDSTE